VNSNNLVTGFSEEQMNNIILIAVVTQLVFLLGEVPAAGYLSQKGLDGSFFHPWFLLFSITRIVGMSGQLYLWSGNQLGLVSALMASCGLVLNNLLGTFVLHQQPLSSQGYIGLCLCVISMFLLTMK
jgi:hypothetical protein